MILVNDDRGDAFFADEAGEQVWASGEIGERNPLAVSPKNEV
jgi:hypothetical protein